MTTTKPMQFERLFRADGVLGQDDYVMRIVIRPGRVELLDVARHKGLTWHQAERYAAEILEASRAARLLADLATNGVNIRFHHPAELDAPLANICAKCGLAIREGVVTTPAEGGGLRHVIGSPECGR